MASSPREGVESFFPTEALTCRGKRLPGDVSEIVAVGTEAFGADGARGISVVVGIKTNRVISYVSRSISEVVRIGSIGLVSDAAGGVAEIIGIESYGAVAYAARGISEIIRVQAYGVTVVRGAGAVAEIVAVELACRSRSNGQQEDCRQE